MDLKQTAFGRTPNNFVTAAKDFGDVTDVYNGIDISFTSRLPNGGIASGGVSAGRERTDFCSVIGQAGMTANTDSTAGRVGETNISNYPSPLYCAVTPPYQPDWKGLISYPLPWGINAKTGVGGFVAPFTEAASNSRAFLDTTLCRQINQQTPPRAPPPRDDSTASRLLRQKRMDELPRRDHTHVD